MTRRRGRLFPGMCWLASSGLTTPLPATAALVLLLMVATIVVSAALLPRTTYAISHVSEDDLWEYELSDGYATITAFRKKGEVAELNIPPQIDGYEVAGITTEVFAGDTHITSVYFPATIRSMGEGAFEGCTKLASAQLYAMESLDSIPNNCFKGCTSLSSETIPASVKNVGDAAFEGCTSLTSLSFGSPSLVESIGEGAFRGCSALTSTEIPHELATIGQEAYAGCSSLATIDVAFGARLATIGPRAFKGCKDLSEVYVPDLVTTVGDEAFADCTSLEVLEFGEFPGHWGSSPFANCTALKTVIMIKLLEHWQWRMLDLPTSVSYLITSFTWGIEGSPCKVLKIGQQGDKTTLVIPAIVGTHPIASIEADASGDGCGLTKVRFDKNSQVTSIGDGAFAGCSVLESINVPASVTKLGTGVFSGCSSLTDISFETTALTNLPADTFKDCDALSTVHLPEGMTTLETNSLAGCKGLSYVYLPDSLKTVQQNTFDASMNKKTLRMPDSDQELDLPDDRFFIPGFSMSTTSFEVTYGSWFEYEWLQPHIDNNHVIEQQRIYKPVDINDGSVTISVSNPTYTSQELMPQLTVSRWKRTLQEGTDFQLAAAKGCDCTNAGSDKTAVLSGVSPHFEKTRDIGYAILTRSVDDVEMGPVDPPCTWDDNPWEPNPGFSLTVGDVVYTLQDGDYKPLDSDSYSNNYKAGKDTATLTLVGAHNFSGTTEFAFSIEPQKLSNATVVVEDQVYTGKDICPVPTSVQVPDRGNDNGSVDLYYDTDYVLSYAHNREVGEAQMTLSPQKGSSVCGSITVTFAIKAAGASQEETPGPIRDKDGHGKSTSGAATQGATVGSTSTRSSSGAEHAEGSAAGAAGATTRTATTTLPQTADTSNSPATAWAALVGLGALLVRRVLQKGRTLS